MDNIGIVVESLDETIKPRQVFFIPGTIYFSAFTIFHLFQAKPNAAAVSPTCGPPIARGKSRIKD